MAGAASTAVFQALLRDLALGDVDRIVVDATHRLGPRRAAKLVRERSYIDHRVWLTTCLTAGWQAKALFDDVGVISLTLDNEGGDPEATLGRDVRIRKDIRGKDVDEVPAYGMNLLAPSLRHQASLTELVRGRAAPRCCCRRCCCRRWPARASPQMLLNPRRSDASSSR